MEGGQGDVEQVGEDGELRRGGGGRGDGMAGISVPVQYLSLFEHDCLESRFLPKVQAFSVLIIDEDVDVWQSFPACPFDVGVQQSFAHAFPSFFFGHDQFTDEAALLCLEKSRPAMHLSQKVSDDYSVLFCDQQLRIFLF